MAYSPLPSDLSTATMTVSNLLSGTHADDETPSPIRLASGIVGLFSSEYESLDEFKSVYFSHQGPVLCFLEPDDIQQAVEWLRPTDDVSVIGEPSELTQWRIERICKTHDQRLDPLTKVFSRDELIREMIPACSDANPLQPASLILTDIDYFKTINSRYGTVRGNQLLQELGQLIQSVCHPAFVARTRGGEFGILVKANGEIARQVATVLKETIFDHPWPEVDRVACSFGVATSFSACLPSLLLTKSDEALFAAKANGRNQVVCYPEIAKLSALDSDQLEVISLENKARVLSERVTSFVTQQSKRIMKTLHREANTDALTQLFNRRYLDKQLQTEFNDAVAYGNKLCVALIDLDHFGEVNKAHGWPTGDKALCEVANAITQSIRISDWVGRYGGEEICIVMPDTDQASAALVCERIRSEIEAGEFETTLGEILTLTVSIGLTELDPSSDQSVNHLIERVSNLTLAAKSMGRNQVCLDSNSLHVHHQNQTRRQNCPAPGTID